MEEILIKEELEQYIKICPKLIRKAEDILMELDENGLLDHKIYYQYSRKPQINAIYANVEVVSKGVTFDELNRLKLSTKTEQVITIIYPIKTKWWKSNSEKSLNIPISCFYDDNELKDWIDKKKKVIIKDEIMRSKDYLKYLELKEKFSNYD